MDVEAQRRVEIVDLNEVPTTHWQPVQSRGGPAAPGSRLPIEYRTLSIHVENKIPYDRKGKQDEKRKLAVRGQVQGILRISQILIMIH
jgi:hypothetical protein